MISFELSKQQKKLQQRMRLLAKDELRPYSLQLEKEPPGPMGARFRRILAEVRLNALIVPEEYGGQMIDRLTLAVVTEEIGYGCAGFACIWASTVHAATTLLIGGTDDQKSRFLPLLLRPSGEVASYASTEAKGGSDSRAFATEARLEKGGYVITGEKCPIINAGFASFYIVWAGDSTGKGRQGINAFVVPQGSTRMSFGPYHDKPGLRSAPTASISFDRVHVPESNLVGLPGSGYLLLSQTVDMARAFVGAICVGLARASMEEIVDFVRHRVTAGRPVIRNQGIRFTLAEMAVELEAARLLVWKASRLIDLGLDYTWESSMAKLMASEVAVKITVEGTQLLGQKGYVEGSPMSKYHEDALALRMIVGTSQIQKMIIASQF